MRSQKKWGISISVQKDNHNIIKLCNKEFRTLEIQDQQSTELGIQDDIVVQGMTDGEEVDTGHQSQEKVVQGVWKNASG